MQALDYNEILERIEIEDNIKKILQEFRKKKI